MLATLILSISVLLQFTAAFYALRLIKVTGKMYSWILISAALFLMVIRRLIPLYSLIFTTESYPIDLSNEVIGLVLSMLMLLGVMGIGPIFTERKRAEEALEKKTEELERSNRELQMFAYVASHDLQEPLRAIHSFTQLLVQRYSKDLDSDAQEFMKFITDGTSRMRQLIQDLLAFSRVQTRGQPFSPVDVNKVLEEVKINLQVAIDETGAVLTKDSLPTIIADQTQMIQVFQNLIQNAIKFRKKEEPPRVHVSAERKGDEWIFSVRDNGIGIDPQYFEKIFVIFQQLHSKGEYPGTGIGLAIVKRIIERHGGRIWIESEPGRGSTFFFTISTESGGT